MRRLMGFTTRITASILLLLTISAWGVSRFRYVDIKAEWIRLDVQAAGVTVFIADWGETNVSVGERRGPMLDDLLFEAPELFLRFVPGAAARWFPGGWFTIIRNDNDNLLFIIIITHTGLVCYAAILNAVVYGLWWRRRRKGPTCDD